jgi:putative membrane protein
MRILVNSLVFTVGLFLVGTCSAVAQQQPGGGGQSPSMPQSNPSRPSSPDMNSPTAQTPNGPAAMTPKVDDKKFVKDAAIGGMAEVELGKLAAEKGSSEAVKQFGQKMVDDHSKANDQLKQLASKEGITIPDTLDSKHQSRVDKLAKLSGPKFDKAYVKDAVKDHEKDVSEFKNEAQYGSDPNVKQFASNTLPVLQEHLTAAKDLNKTEKAQKQSSGQ